MPGPNEYTPTFFDNYEATIIMDNKDEVKMSLWDTAGEEQRGGSFRKLSYPKTDIFLICFSIITADKEKTLNRIDFFKDEITYNIQKVPIYLVGMKMDLREDTATILQGKKGEGIISPEEGEEIANKIGAVKYWECSAKTRNNVKALFDDVLLYCYNSNKDVKI